MSTEESVACRSYTHARRYPWVIGKIGGWNLPTQLSLPQLAAMGTGLLLVVQTRGLWAHLPRVANLLVEIAVPGACGWATRHLRIEGRAPFRALAGLAAYLAAPPLGRAQGRPLREAPARSVLCHIYVAGPR
jgi:TcpE family